MLHLVYGGQFDTVAFELDCDLHLLARIRAANIAASTLYSARRIGSSYDI